MKWYPLLTMECPLCKTVPDTHDHLFFQCEFSQKIWAVIKNKARINCDDTTWDEIVRNLSKFKNHNQIWSIIQKLCIATTVYFLWQERNYRIFKKEERDEQTLIKIICDEVRAKLMSLKTKKSIIVLNAQRSWEF